MITKRGITNKPTPIQQIEPSKPVEINTNIEREKKEQLIYESKSTVKWSIINAYMWLIDFIIIILLFTIFKSFLNELISLNPLAFMVLLFFGTIIYFINRNINKQFRKITRTWKLREKSDKIVEDEIKRLSFIRRMWFKFRIYQMKTKLEEMRDKCERITDMIGDIKGNEDEALRKAKIEMIDNILLWTEDFKINYYVNGEDTGISVDRNGLEQLDIDDLYENYLLACVRDADQFINGKIYHEKMVRI